MGVYKKAVITDAGNNLLTRAIAGEVTMQFSHAKTSSYAYPEGTDFSKLSDLQEVKQTVVPSNVQVVNDTLISVRALFGNENIQSEYLIQNVGLYATDGSTEILFSVCQASTADQMPVYNGVAPSSFIYNIQVTVSQASSISLSVNTAGTATTQDILELDQKKINAHGGDISDTIVSELVTSEVEFPIPEPGEETKTLLGKVKKFIEDFKNWMAGVCLIGQIVNDCVTDNSSLPLSAAQGKALMDLYTVLNTKLKWNYVSQDESGNIVLPSDWTEGIITCWFTNNSTMIIYQTYLLQLQLQDTIKRFILGGYSLGACFIDATDQYISLNTCTYAGANVGNAKLVFRYR